MNTTWKWVLEMAAGVQEFEMPCGAEILDLQLQGGAVCMWALVDPGEPAETRRFQWNGTGAPEIDLDARDYVGTVQFARGTLVFHLFEVRAYG